MTLCNSCQLEDMKTWLKEMADKGEEMLREDWGGVTVDVVVVGQFIEEIREKADDRDS